MALKIIFYLHSTVSGLVDWVKGFTNGNVKDIISTGRNVNMNDSNNVLNGQSRVVIRQTAMTTNRNTQSMKVEGCSRNCGIITNNGADVLSKDSNGSKNRTSIGYTQSLMAM